MAIQIGVAELIGDSPIISLGSASFTDPKPKLGWIKRGCESGYLILWRLANQHFLRKSLSFQILSTLLLAQLTHYYFIKAT